MCPYSWEGGIRGAMERGNEVTRVVDMGALGPDININQRLTCRSENVVYLAKDTRDSKLYMGEMGREVRERLAEHIRSIENRNYATVVGKHFTRANH